MRTNGFIAGLFIVILLIVSTVYSKSYVDTISPTTAFASFIPLSLAVTTMITSLYMIYKAWKGQL